MAHNRNVKFIKPSEPSFLKAFKAKVGYSEKEVTVDTKKETGDKKDEGDRYIEDELPTIVTEGGNIMEEEYKEYMMKQQQAEESVAREELQQTISSPVGPDPHPKTEVTEPANENVRIVFKRPNKRTSSETDKTNEDDSSGGNKGLYSSSSKRTPVRDQGKRNIDNKSKRKGVKNSSLLSFEDDT